jgi:hypothetical protein
MLWRRRHPAAHGASVKKSMAATSTINSQAHLALECLYRERA